MKRIIYSAALLSSGLFLASCHTMNDVGNAGASTLRTGTTMVSNTAGAVGNAGVRVISTTGNAVGSFVKGGVGLITGQPATKHDVTVYKKNGVVNKNGHQYKVINGKYVLVS